MKFQVKLLTTILLLSFFTGCKKGGSVTDPIIPDTTKPIITIIKPTAAQAFNTGTTIPFEASFSDNVKLQNYEVAISKTPTGGLILKNVPTSVPFSFTKSLTSFNTGVKQQNIILTDISIPANNTTTITTPGNYNLKVTCYDGSGNKTEIILVFSIN